jgi:hypothetical protein
MHLRRLIVLITNARNLINHPRSCTEVVSIVGLVSLSRTRSGTDQKKNLYSHVLSLFLSEGVGSNETNLHLFTMSKYPALET